MDCSPPDSSVHGIFQARILEWAAISFSRVFLTQGLNLGLLPCKADSLPAEPLGKPKSAPKLGLKREVFRKKVLLKPNRGDYQLGW